jgi:hypothetical protein
MRALLTDTPDLPEITRKALRGRSRKPKSRLYEAYSRDEFHRIRAAASAILHTGQRRIDKNLASLNEYRGGLEPADAPTAEMRGTRWTAGALLDHLARTGTVPRGMGDTDKSRGCRSLLDLNGARSITEALFPNAEEAASLGFLFACTLGYNPSVIDRLRIADRADDHLYEAPIHVTHVDKPRRGPAARFSDESLGGDAGRVMDRAQALTAQARRTMTALGGPTDSLLIYRVGYTYRGHRGPAFFRTGLPPQGMVHPRWHERAGLVGDDGAPLQVTFQRLRLTEQVLNAKPRQNSPDVSESVYRRPDPHTRKVAAAAIIRGQQDALEHAQITVAMRSLTEEEIGVAHQDPSALSAQLGVAPEKVRMLLSGALNTATGACLDFKHSPFSEREGQACPASFLACLGCTNAIATPTHLPRLVALFDALERIASVVTSAVWAEDYSRYQAQLSDLLGANTTPEQRDAARGAVSDADEDLIFRLLTRGLDT